MTESTTPDGMETPPDYRAIAADPKAAARATAAVLMSRVVVAALGWIGSVVIARTLSPDEWGQFSFVFALLGLMSVVTDLGVGRVVLARLIDDDVEEIARTASSFLALRFVLGLVGYLLAIAYVLVLGYPSEVVLATAVGGLVVVFATPSHALSVLFQARHRLLLVAVAESVGQVLQLALTVLAAVFAPTLLWFVLPAVANEIFKLVTKGFGIRSRSVGLRPSRHIEIRRWGPYLKEAVPLAIGFALTIAMLKIDVLMLSLLDNFDAVGLYSIGYKFSDMIDTFTLAAVAPVSTLLIASWPDDLTTFRERSRSAATLFIVFGAMAVAGFWPSAEPLIQLLYGDRFVEGAHAARLLVLGAALMSLVMLGIFVLASAGMQRHYPVVALLGLAINVGLNLVLIPRMSYNGAAISTVVTIGVTLVLLWIVIERSMPMSSVLPVRSVAAVAIACAAVSGVAYVAVQQFSAIWLPISVLSAALVGAIVFALVAVGAIESPLPSANKGRHARR
ncbi:flippase [Rhodococcoides kyotonense]|uniref:Membrane protein involved in the export of O-antigen and teichoic acid n=1 Tax=Rhodococcoides kyotonense TaxID=398843 RepID=A0A239HA53_9NOCA|nr:flippase [Rhodococcus kyotonensis]SNS78279.1 Membrane protein involved in the export of O-antigen and teichoic acid [Rhodococcus kyotonensis]